MLTAGDGVRIEAVYTPCTARSGAAGGEGRGETAVVLAHGFTGAADRPALLRAAGVFAQRAAVITFSFRGHGKSGGRSTVGDREVLDLAAAVAWARSLGHRRVVTVGFSMGGSVVLRHAALYTATAEEAEDFAVAGDSGVSVDSCDSADGECVESRESAESEESRPAEAERVGRRAEAHGAQRGRRERTPVHSEVHPDTTPDATRDAIPDAIPDAHADVVVAVSAPARWYYRGTAPMRRLHWVVTRPAGRLVGRYGFGTRIHREDWNPVPLSPVQAVPLITAPLLIVHGDRDPYFPVDHPRMLAQAAEGRAELWLEHGMGHAENAADEELLTRIADWADPA
ncbi:alpha/beta hydrolase [Streptomyces sp. NBC_01012]|uniref:alpha/beta hydrolase n=1 Tax=Streptomyces sp. NBC_01012 TaxID=2903717 RepID=UPI003869E1F5|nr:alpha/beta fold hydrolase [Streptomyces sp. NBC_01012]